MKVRDNAALNCSFIKTTVGDFVCEVTSEFIPRVRHHLDHVINFHGVGKGCPRPILHVLLEHKKIEIRELAEKNDFHECERARREVSKFGYLWTERRRVKNCGRLLWMPPYEYDMRNAYCVALTRPHFNFSS